MKDFLGATFCFLGRSGSGKDTQAQLLKEYLEKEGRPILWISTGDLGRQLMKEDTVAGRRVKRILENGELFSDWLAIGLWFCAIKDQLKDNEALFFSSSPRYLREAQAIDELMTGGNRFLPIPIHININDEEATRRLLARKRNDDTPKVIAERLSWFNGQMLPIIDFYDKRVIEVDGNGSIEEINKKIMLAISNYEPQKR